MPDQISLPSDELSDSTLWRFLERMFTTISPFTNRDQTKIFSHETLSVAKQAVEISMAVFPLTRLSFLFMETPMKKMYLNNFVWNTKLTMRYVYSVLNSVTVGDVNSSSVSIDRRRRLCSIPKVSRENKTLCVRRGSAECFISSCILTIMVGMTRQAGSWN